MSLDRQRPVVSLRGALSWRSCCGPTGRAARKTRSATSVNANLNPWSTRPGLTRLVALIRGDSDSDGERVTRVMAHMDELSMLVKRVEPDGTLHLAPLGTMYPGNFGLGPVAILGRHETLIGVLTLGSEHTTSESQRIWETKPDQGDKSLDWMHVYVFTGRTRRSWPQRGWVPAHASVWIAASGRWWRSVTISAATSWTTAPR